MVQKSIKGKDRKMKVEIEKHSGFCFGVERAIKMAEEALDAGEEIFSLGHIVHNEAEVERLERLGLVTINHDEFRKLRNKKVLIRAHGEPPETYDTARDNNIELIEATCPIVKSIQKTIKDDYNNNGEQVQNLLFGKEEHAEVIGLVGQTGGKSILLSGLENIEKVDFNRPAAIFSQTTRSRERYAQLVKALKKEYKKAGHDPDFMLQVNNTICAQVANREPRLKKFCSKYDIIIFVSGKNSSNGKMLYKVCSDVNSDSHFISDESEIDYSWFKGVSSVGVCGATSTPKWLIRKVAEKIKMADGKRI
ncbi:MAG: 4-hydroxy-3-methylbut-2-enyl diphosphate reductase [Bacteroidales bacterium]|nr:4-hydroxy-3-methylbut-2-enyl diphosphate reductase [Bacteroidales bacterium]